MSDKPKHGFLYYFYDLVVHQLNNGVQLDAWMDSNKLFLDKTCHPWVSKSLQFSFVYFLGHAILLSGLVKYILVIYPMKHGNFKLPVKLPKIVDVIRSELTLFLLAFSVLFHVNAWPALKIPWSMPFNWGFTLRPQINVKPQMSLKPKKSKSEIFPPSESEEKTAALKSCRSKSCSALEDSESRTSVDFSFGVRVRDGVTDKVWSSLQKLTDTISLASGLSQAEFFNNSLKTGSNVTENSRSSSFGEFEFDEEELKKIDVETHDLADDSWMEFMGNETVANAADYLTKMDPILEESEGIVEFPSSDDETEGRGQNTGHTSSFVLIQDVTEELETKWPKHRPNASDNQLTNTDSESDSSSEVMA